MPPVFDPAKPYTEAAPEFDPSQPYTEAKGDTPTFDPSKPYTEVKKKTRREIMGEIEAKSDNDSDEKTALYNALGWLGSSDFSPVVSMGNALRNTVNLPTNIEKVTGILPEDARQPMESNTPSLPIPQLKPGTLTDIAAKLGINELANSGSDANVTGIINGVSSVISGFSTPENLTALAGAGAGGAPAKVVGALFAGQMIHGMDEASQRTAEVINNPDATDEERARALTELGAHALMTTALAKHGVAEKAPVYTEPKAKDFKLDPLPRLTPEQEADLLFKLNKAPQTAQAVIEVVKSTADPEFKPTEPFTEVPASEAPASDFARYTQLVEDIKAIPNTLENFSKKAEIAKEVEAIKNRNGGMPPKEPVVESVPPEKVDPWTSVDGGDGFYKERFTGEYQPAVKLKSGEIVTGVEHGDAIKNTGLVGDEARGLQRGYLTKDGKFLTMLEVAREKMAEKKKSTPTEPAFDPAKPFEEVPPAEGELVGMGGAVESEFTPQESFTSVKNASVDADRVKMGLPPRMAPLRQTHGEAHTEAMAKIDADPNYQESLINDLKQNPRTINPIETVVLEHRMVDVKNEYDKATRRVSQAYEDGRVDDIPREQGQRDYWADKFQELADLSDKLGTKAGQDLAARKLTLKSDFSLATMEYEKRASANNGAPLTEKQRADVQKQHDRIVETNNKLEERIAELEKKASETAATEAHEAMVKEVEKAPEFGADVIRIAKGIVDRWDKEADAARQSLKERLGRTSAGLDPTLLVDLAKIGRSYFGHAALEIGAFSSKLIGEFGDLVAPHVKEIYDASRKLISDEEKTQPERVRKAIKNNQGTADKKTAITEAIKEKLDAKDNEISFLVQKLARAFVESGIKKRDELIDAVHGVLVTIDKEITRRDAMDAISGYGKFKQLSKDAISVELRDLKGQMQQVAKLEDMQAGSAPSKTGVERRTPSDEERRLIQQVNEVKRKGGFTVTDPAKQLKTSLEAIKTRLKHQIADLGHQIATGTKIVRDKTKAPEDAEVKTLREQRDKLKADFDNIFGKKEMTDAQRLKLATAAAERSLAEYERRVKEKDFSKRETESVSSPELEAIKTRRDALRAEYEMLKDLAEGVVKKTPEERAMQSLKTRLINRTAELQDKLARGDFSIKERKQVDISKDAEAMRLKGDNIRAKKEWEQGKERDRLARRSTGQKVVDVAKESLNLPRNILSSWDLSAVLRQGGFIALGNPVRATRSAKAMFQSLLSEREAYRLEAQLLSRPNAHLYARSKLYLPALTELRLTAKEEAIMSNLGDKIPGVKQSNRAFITFLNQLRADSFDSMVENLAKDGTKPTDVEINAISNYINVATGRGYLGNHAVAANTLATVLFSPRLMTSRFQLIAGQPFYGGSNRTRMLFVKEYGKTLAGLAVVYALGQIAGAEIEHDPRSSDFGKMKFGNTRIDPLMGLAQNTVLLSRLGVGEIKNVNGEVKSIRGDDMKYGQTTGSELIGRFLRTKLNPVLGTAVDAVTGKNVVGEKVTPANTALNLVVPLSFRDIYDIMKEHGIAAGTAIELLSIFGMGVQNYQDKHSQSKAEKEELEKYLKSRK